MKNLKDFKQYNEGLSPIVFGAIALFLLYKFLKGLFRSLAENKQKKMFLNTIIKDIGEAKNNTSDKVGISDFNDRYFIRVQTAFGPIDFRLLKNTKELVINDVKYDLSDEQYNDFIKIIKTSPAT